MSVSLRRRVPPQPGQTVPAGAISARSTSNQKSAPSTATRAATRSKISGGATTPPQSSQSSTVIGTPQERWREMHQSGRWAIIPAMRSRPHEGIQRTRSICSRAAVRSPPCSIEMNHWLVARKITGCLQRQQCG